MNTNDCTNCFHDTTVASTSGSDCAECECYAHMSAHTIMTDPMISASDRAELIVAMMR